MADLLTSNRTTMKDNHSLFSAAVDKPDPAESELPEHLRFYRLCGVIAAASSVLVSLLLFLLDAEDFTEVPLNIAILLAGPVTLLLLLGGFFYPRIAGWLLLLNFCGGLFYLYLQDVQFNLLISSLFICFYLFGAVAVMQESRSSSRPPLWLAGKQPGRIVALILLAVLIALCVSGYLSRWLALKQDNPLQWVEYRKTMVARYVDGRPGGSLMIPGMTLKRVRLENRTLVYAYRANDDGAALDEARLAGYARSVFLPHCQERGVKEFGMKLMFVFHQGQTENIFVFADEDCVAAGGEPGGTQPRSESGAPE